MPSPTPAAEPRRRPAMVVAGSLLAGLGAAVALVAGPLAGGAEPAITGGLLLGYAAGWALPAGLSVRFTDRPQRWAAVPAAAMGISGAGLIALAPGSDTLTALGWVWPPLLLALVTWIIVRARRRPASRLQPWLLYPIFAALALTAIGGGYQTPANATDQPVAHVAGSRLIDVGGGRRLSIRSAGSRGRPSSSNPGSATPRGAWRAGSPPPSHPPRRSLSTTAPATGAATPSRPKASTRRATCTSCSSARTPRPLRARRPFARRHVRPELRPPLPGAGRRHRPTGLHAPPPAQRLRRHPAAARTPTDARAHRTREPALRSQRRRPDDAGPPARPRYPGHAGRAQPGRPADPPRQQAPDRPQRRHRLAPGLGRAAERPR